jgi:hypothetical protein
VNYAERIKTGTSGTNTPQEEQQTKEMNIRTREQIFFEAMVEAEGQIDKLAKFLMSHPFYQSEIGKTDEPAGEGAVECAIRLLTKYAPTPSKDTTSKEHE